MGWNQTDHYNDRDMALGAAWFLLIVAITTVISNGILLLALVVDPIKQFRSPPMYLIMNLALADFLTEILVDPFFVVYYMTCYRGEPDMNMSKVGVFNSFVTVNTALWTTVALVCERYLCIIKPFRYSDVTNKKNVLVASSLIWVYSAASALVLLRNFDNKVYKLLDAHVNFSISTLIMTALLLGIYRFLRKQSSNDILRFIPSQSSRRKELIMKAKRDKRMLNTIIVILALLSSCFAPYAIFVHIDFFNNSRQSFTYHLLNRLSDPFVFLNSGVNPFIYAWRHKVFRKSIRRVIYRRPIASLAS